MMKIKSKERWTKDEDCKLVELWSESRSVEEIGRELGRTFGSVKTRENHRGCLFDGPVNRTKWTPEQDRVILELWAQGKSNQEIGDVLGRTASAVQSRTSHLNCGTKDVRQNVIQVTADGKRLWSKEEDRLLVEMRRQGGTAREIGVSLGRSGMSVSGRIDTLNKLPVVAPDDRKSEKRISRPCMKCKALFMSDGRGNRHCNPCREWLAEAA